MYNVNQIWLFNLTSNLLWKLSKSYNKTNTECKIIQLVSAKGQCFTEMIQNFKQNQYMNITLLFDINIFNTIIIIL